MRQVLVVENYPAICLAIHDALEETGNFRVSTAPTARTALALLELERPDLAIIDAVLPGRFSGIELASDVIAKDVPVVFITGEPGINRRLAKFGIPHLGKPFHCDDLLRQVSRTLADSARNLQDIRQRLRRLTAEMAKERAQLRFARERSSELVARAKEVSERARAQARRSGELLRKVETESARTRPRTPRAPEKD
jgi:DNA-binding NtrC family response regulator